MRLCMRQVEGASENMAELVMQGHAHHAENLAAQPGSIERLRARFDLRRPLREPRQGTSECGDALP